MLRPATRAVERHDHGRALTLAERARRALGMLAVALQHPELLSYDLSYIADRVRRVEIEMAPLAVETWAALTTSALRREGRVVEPTPWPVSRELTRETVLPLARHLVLGLDACRSALVGQDKTASREEAALHPPPHPRWARS